MDPKSTLRLAQLRYDDLRQEAVAWQRNRLVQRNKLNWQRSLLLSLREALAEGLISVGQQLKNNEKQHQHFKEADKTAIC